MHHGRWLKALRAHLVRQNLPPRGVAKRTGITGGSENEIRAKILRKCRCRIFSLARTPKSWDGNWPPMIRGVFKTISA